MIMSVYQRSGALSDIWMVKITAAHAGHGDKTNNEDYSAFALECDVLSHINEVVDDLLFYRIAVTIDVSYNGARYHQHYPVGTRFGTERRTEQGETIVSCEEHCSHYCAFMTSDDGTEMILPCGYVIIEPEHGPIDHIDTHGPECWEERYGPEEQETMWMCG